MNLGLEKKVVLVTAASKGIGKAIAQGFVAEGSDVIITSRSVENLHTTAREIEAAFNKKVDVIRCDLNIKEDIHSAFMFITEKYGRLDVLVNNCGGPSAGFFDDLPDESWEFAYKQVLMSAVRLTKLALPVMKKNKWGRIINITSVSALQPVDNLILSNTFRSGLTAFSKTLSEQVAKEGITINNVAPGYTLTDRVNELVKKRAEQNSVSEDEVLAGMVKNIPMTRMASPEEIASSVAFLASERASYITGVTLHVDGGYIKGLF
ncbi:MAG: SDR family oxidoreductase [Ignavibacteriaceae bacterium]